MSREKKSAVVHLIALLTIVIALFLAMKFLPFQQWLRNFNSGIGQVGTGGIFSFIRAYAAAPLLLATGAILTLRAGFGFGLWKGFPPVPAGATLGAALA